MVVSKGDVQLRNVSIVHREVSPHKSERAEEKAERNCRYEGSASYLHRCAAPAAF